MKHFAVQQGSEEWLALRRGIPTASEFERIITPAKIETKDGIIKGWNPTKGETRLKYAVKLVTELILGCSLDDVNTASMQHGKDWEPKARRAYEMMQGADVEECGFCTIDDGLVGASPDGFVGDEGSIELKCPERPEIHVGYLLRPETLSDEYWVQTQGQLYVTGRKWTDLCSYFMGIPMAVVRITPEPEFQRRLAASLAMFQREIVDLVERAKQRGVVFRRRTEPEAPRDHSADFLSREDEDLIVAARFPGGRE